jgi:4'-phosphopantetheinyl transferase
MDILPLFSADHSIDVWYSKDLAQTALSEDELFTLVSAEERLIARDHKHRLLYLRRKAGLRWVLSHYLSIPPSEIVITRDARGKPHLENSPLLFSLSHSSTVWAVAISQNTSALGLDIESRPKPRNLLPISERYFAADEHAHLLSLTDNALQQAFYERWTLKEAFLKAVGCGISGGLNSLIIHNIHRTQSNLSDRDEYAIDASISQAFMATHSVIDTDWHWLYCKPFTATHIAIAHQSTAVKNIRWRKMDFFTLQ